MKSLIASIALLFLTTCSAQSYSTIEVFYRLREGMRCQKEGAVDRDFFKCAPGLCCGKATQREKAGGLEVDAAAGESKEIINHICGRAFPSWGAFLYQCSINPDTGKMWDDCENVASHREKVFDFIC